MGQFGLVRAVEILAKMYEHVQMYHDFQGNPDVKILECYQVQDRYSRILNAHPSFLNQNYKLEIAPSPVCSPPVWMMIWMDLQKEGRFARRRKIGPK